MQIILRETMVIFYILLIFVHFRFRLLERWELEVKDPKVWQLKHAEAISRGAPRGAPKKAWCSWLHEMKVKRTHRAISCHICGDIGPFPNSTDSWRLFSTHMQP